MPKSTPCTSLSLANHGRRQVCLGFDGGRMTSDGGALLLRAADHHVHLTRRLARCFRDHRDPRRCEHPLQQLVSQRLFGLVLGYEDINDHDQLRSDSVLALAVGTPDIHGEHRARQRDRGHPLAGSSTLNRMELGDPEHAAGDRYKRIVADTAQLDRLLVELFLDSYQKPPKELILDVDATDDPVHGEQEGRFFHAYYDEYCYLPLYVTCGPYVLCGRLRTANRDAADGALEELQRIVAQIRERWPQVRVIVRGDAGFCREPLMAWCEAQERVDYVFGLAGNKRLAEAVARQQNRAGSRCVTSGKAARRYRSFRYRTRESWSRKRRVVAKAEWLPGPRGRNQRFVVTSMSRKEWKPKELYEKLYCARGDMENRIKEQQLHLFADRTSAGSMRANQLRMYWALFGAMLLEVLRRVALVGTKLAKAQYGTMRALLLKVAGEVRVSVRRVRVRISSVFPRRELFAQCLARFGEALAS